MKSKNVQFVLSHVAISAGDYKKSMDFYCNVLGLKDKLTLKGTKGEKWMTFTKLDNSLPDNYPQFIEVFDASEKKTIKVNDKLMETPVMPKGITHFCLVVDDIEEAAKYLESKGISLWNDKEKLPVPYVKPDIPAIDGTFAFFIKDPDGNSVAIVEYAKDCLLLKK
jgi:lactoylglutathione lyase